MKIFNRLLYLLLMSITPANKKYLWCKLFYKVKFGRNVNIIGFPRWASEAYLITIGDDVTITHHVVFHTHDGGVRVFRNNFPGINVYGKITVGNNVFIGSDTIIMPNVSIGNNVVIGSGSIVAKSIPDNVVAVGIPARAIKSIKEYRESCLKKGMILPPDLSRKEKEYFIKRELN